MKKRIYLDYAATTPTDQRVVEAMLPYFTQEYGNASSLHALGANAKTTLGNCRRTIAGFVGAEPEEIIFTSGGTEANNFALKGIAFANRYRGNHIIVSAIEHDCVLNTAKWLEDTGFVVSYLPVESDGLVNPEMLQRMINPRTILVSVMHANNEIGTIQPLEAIGKICYQRHVYFHSDACQSFGKIPLNVNALHIDLLTLNSHKIYGPKGVGALYVRKGTVVTPLLHGGGQEYGLRSTTENLPGIVGFAKAAELCFAEMEEERKRQLRLRDKIIYALQEFQEDAYLNGDPMQRLPGNINFSFHGLEGETIRLMLLLDEEGIAVSTGSACSNNDKSYNASHVLQAIGRDPFEARGAIRLSIGRFTTEEDVDFFLETMKNALFRLHPIFS
ncbi:MAG: cysteine desulfurase [Lentimicrobiaceae bacterium]|nr:cysteine desulfurase [Lentimicrobiaceae bacterium]